MQRALSTHLIVCHRLNTVWLERIREAGFPLVEIFCARQHLDYHNKEQIGELACWFADSRLKLHSLHSPMYNDDVWGRTGPGSVVSITETSKPRRLASVDEIKRALEVAERIPCRYLIQHVGVGGEEFSEEALEAAFRALEDISLFARHRGVEVLLENIPNGLSSAARLDYFLNTTHLDLGICLDTGHANMHEGVEAAFEILGPRIRSTHIHDNNGVDDVHLYPLLAQGGAIDWPATMQTLRSRAEQYPLLLELRESPEFPRMLESAREAIDRLENL